MNTNKESIQLVHCDAPDFNKIHPEDYLRAFEAAIQQKRDEIVQITENHAEKRTVLCPNCHAASAAHSLCPIQSLSRFVVIPPIDDLIS